MTDTFTSHLKSLHALAIDSQNGYREALEKTAGQGLTGLFETMETLHGQHARELAIALQASGAEADNGGSLLTLVNKTIIDLKSMFGGDKVSLLPGMIDGESRIIAKYDSALTETDFPARETEILRRQRDRLAEEVEQMRRLQAVADQAKKAV